MCKLKSRLSIFIIIISIATLIAGCAISEGQPTLAPEILATEAPLQTPEPTAILQPTFTATPIPDPYRIAEGYLEFWDGVAYQQLVEASSFMVDETHGWVTTFGLSSAPAAVYIEQTGTTVTVENGRAVVDGIHIAWDGQQWVEQQSGLWVSGGVMEWWDSTVNKYVEVVGLDGMAVKVVEIGKSEAGWQWAKNADGEITAIAYDQELFFTVAGRLQEWREGAANEVNVYASLPDAVREKPEKMRVSADDLWLSPEEMKLRVGDLLPKEFVISKFEILPNGAVEVSDTDDNLMLVKPVLTESWVVTPLGYRLWESRWQKWDGETGVWVEEWNIPYEELNTAQEKIAQLVEEKLINKEFRPGEMQMISPYLSYHLEVNPEKAKEGFMELVRGFIGSTWPEATKYWSELGFTRDMTDEQIWQKLQSYKNEAGEIGWLPAETDGGTRFTYIQHSGARIHMARGGYWENDKINERESFRLDGMYVVAFAPAEWASNPMTRAWISVQGKVAANNWNFFLGDCFTIDQLNNIWGIVPHTESGRLIFIVGNPTLLPKGNERYMDAEQMGGSNQIFRADRDPQLAAAYYQLYFRAFFHTLMPGSNDTEINCVSFVHYNSCDVVITPAEAEPWFVTEK